VNTKKGQKKWHKRKKTLYPAGKKGKKIAGGHRGDGESDEGIRERGYDGIRSHDWKRKAEACLLRREAKNQRYPEKGVLSGN